jgi:nitrite reductase (NO-forming)
MAADRSSTATALRREPAATKRRRWPLLAAAGAIAAAVLGVGIFALFGGFDRKVTERVSGAGTQVVRVALVDAVIGFDVTPDVLEVTRGTHVVLDVVNEGDEDHDLAVESGGKTRTLNPGESQHLDLGTVVGDSPAWCTLPGHKAAGMTLDIQVVDKAASERSKQEATLGTRGTRQLRSEQ